MATTIEESTRLCRELFLAEKERNRIFYAVNRKYNALLRLPTAEDLAIGLETQEAAKHARVKPTHVIATRADANWEPVFVTAPDGRRILDAWAMGAANVPEKFDFTGTLVPGVSLRATRQPGRPCAYIRLRETLRVTWKRAEEVWAPGSFMSCFDETALASFTSVTPVSFPEMKEPADANSAAILEQLLAEPLPLNEPGRVE